MTESSSIALLQHPPSWGLASSADSDWIVRQRMLKEQGTKLNRYQRKKRKKLDYINESSPVMSADYSEKGDKPPLKAVIASGTGPDGRAEARKLRKKRKILAQSVAIIVFSLVALLGKSYFFSTPNQKHLPTHNRLSVEEDSRPGADGSVDAIRQQEPLAISSEDKQHAETIPLNQKLEPQMNDESCSKGNECKNAPTKSNIVENEESDGDEKVELNSDTQQLVISTSATSVPPHPPTRLQQLTKAIGHINAAVEEEISFEMKGRARSAEAAQEIWRGQANNIKLQAERLLTFSKECLARGQKLARKLLLLEELHILIH